jgi:hypothetical protein
MPSMEAVPKLLTQPAPQVIDSGRPTCRRDAVRKVHVCRTRAQDQVRRKRSPPGKKTLKGSDPRYADLLRRIGLPCNKRILLIYAPLRHP